MLFVCGKNSGTLTQQMVMATFSQLVTCIAAESDASFLASLYKCFTDAMRVIGGPSALPAEYRDRVIDATKTQLQAIADKRRNRTQRPLQELEDDREDLALIEEMEDFALEDMSKMLQYFDPNHQLLIAVSSVRDLGIRTDQWDSEDEGGNDG